jgi:hypothetical protein
MSTTLHETGICDSEAARLLPWLVTGRLSEGDAARVNRHLEECAICRADVGEQRDLRSALRTEGPVEFAPQAGLAATLARIDELARDVDPPVAASRPGRESVAPRRPGMTQWLAAAVVVQAVGLGVLAAAFLHGAPTARAPADYETLSSPTAIASAPLIRAVFDTSMTVGELKTLLTSQHLSIVGGPTEAGVLTLGAADSAVGAARLDASLAGLRANPHVLFAEPVAAARAKVP